MNHPTRTQLQFTKAAKLLSFGGATLLLLLAAACQSNTSSGSGLKIGTLLSVTGDLSQFGASMQDSANLLVKTVNDCGGVLGQPVQLISENDQTNPAAGAAAMTKLAEVNQVGGVVGATGSGVSSAAVDIAVRNQVVQISPSSTSPVFTERAKKGDFQGFWFRTAPPDSFQGEALAKLARSRGFKTVSVLAINNDYGRGLVNSFTSAFTPLGGKVLNQAKPTYYPPEASSFESEVAEAFRGNPDAVLLVAYPETGSLILKAAYQQGLLGKKTQVILTDGMKDTKIAEMVGKNAQGEYITTGMIGTAASAGGAALKQFSDRYQTAYNNRQPVVYGPNTWDAAAVLALAAEAAKSTSGVAIRDKIREVANPPGQDVSDVCQALSLVRQGQDINYQGASGNLDFDSQGDVTGNYDVWTIEKNGQLKVVNTISVRGS
ncbi:ABC transporter substrate-binding protein [Aerosakkonemataceae cyanobacterium BLCC-F154]|uniref:ABC transporter substrate-binding protein n=1 Tax=Floridaenema fluviatile BLCC-F154 TaxID=3153640 RepID=A0ABV4Y5Q7_9CYAN